MKILRILILILSIVAFSCGTKHKVITNSGEIYQVEGDKFFHRGKDVTETITAEKKDHIITTLNERLESEAEVLAQKQAIEKAREEAEELQEEAEKAQKEAEKEAEELSDKLEEEAETRKDFIDAKEDLKDAQSKYEKLRDRGKLSPNDETKWAKKLEKLLKKLEKAEEKFNNL